MLTLRAPGSKDAKILLPDEVADMAKPYNGRILADGNKGYLIENNIVDILDKDYLPMTWAQRSNKFRLTAMFYEKSWRLKSISKLTGRNFTLDDEKALLLDWLRPKSKGIYLDLGCSTALYARTIAGNMPEAVNVAIDISLPMLENARDRGLEEKVNMFLLHADARELPFFDTYVDGIVCGGSLNEFSEPRQVLSEARRVIKDDGTFFIMYIQNADSKIGRTLQAIPSTGGLTFYTIEESNRLFKSSGFHVEERYDLGVISFARLRPV